MSEHTYKVIEIVGSSSDGLDAAIKNAVARASQTLDQLRWFHVTDIRGHLDAGQVAHYQVTVKIGFTLNDGSGDA